ncbi:hypothetical protein HAPAU_32630 [Halalkalicoccus paucihalophilus]|uniref:Uncharacterized protein n=1 Tax=Halalkalicoccus paucihalophilus TaxID=1008153 RepID=A0A151A9P6_9EURY|nr:hypothetical protein [Halalkalicoccus paucihalophilus]KYH24280.1 hypothetical protein HAPAU_32630 [Halalkalicoccus paucihalophilus]
MLDLDAFGRIITRCLDLFDRHGVGVIEIALATFDGMELDAHFAKINDEQHSPKLRGGGPFLNGVSGANGVGRGEADNTATDHVLKQDYSRMFK